MLRNLRNAGARAWLALVEAWARLRRRGPYRVLHLRIAGELDEEASPGRLRALLGRKSDDYFALISLLHWAREDPDLRAVLVSIDTLSAGWARIQGLRRALLALRASGKTVWVHLTHAGVPEYFLACAGEKVFLTSAGLLDLAGLSAETTFFLGTLEKLGVRAEVVQVGQYKAAGEPFTRKEMSASHREMVETLVDDLYGQLAQGVAEGRGLALEDARALLGRGPFVAREAVEQKLIDEVAYLDEIEKRLSGAHEETPLTDRPTYAGHRGRQVRREALRAKQKAIAVVYIAGAIKSGENAPGNVGAGSETICRELERLEKRDDVAAVVLRINSPGGSGLASDLIWRAVKLLRASKPVVISLGDVAASGGYYIAAAGAPVLAEAGTITGSIGVIAGKATLQGLYAQLGISKDIVSRGENASIHSDYLPLGQGGRARLESEARAFYDNFLAKVAEGRQLAIEKVATVAEGRVWTGQQALAHGLVDQIGGLLDALAEAKVLAGIGRDTPVALERLPRPRRAWGLSLLQHLPLSERLEALSPWLAVARSERVWALMPFELRFF
jgi:protease IV